jgi:hypothetical protein
VSGLGIRLYTDEHVYADLAHALRGRGFDAESCQEAGLAGQAITDERQLLYASERQRALLTYNIGDFSVLHLEWQRQGKSHSGIVLTLPMSDFGQLLRAVISHLETYSPDQQNDMLLWLKRGVG